MLLLTCPHFGVTAEETEFTPGREAYPKRHASAATNVGGGGHMVRRNPPGGLDVERRWYVDECGPGFDGIGVAGAAS